MTAATEGPATETQRQVSPWGRLFVYVLLLSLTVRVLWVAGAYVSPIGDHYGYNRSALEWIGTGEYRVQGRLYAYKPPGYPAFLAAVYSIFGHDWKMVGTEQAAVWQPLGPVLAHDWKVVGFVQALMGAVVSGLLALLAGRTVSLRVGIIAGLLHAFWPTSIVFVPVLANDNLLVFLLITGLICLASVGDARGLSRGSLACVAGLCYGFMLVVRPSSIFFLPAWFVLAAFDPIRRVWRRCVLLLCVVSMSVIIGPWLYRTYSLGFGLGTFSTQAGYALWWGNNWRSIDGGNPAPPRFAGDRELSEIEQHRFFLGKAIDWITHNPARYLALCRTRFIRLLGKQHDGWAAKYFFPTMENDRLIRAVYWKGTAEPEDVRKGRELELRNRRLHMYFRVVMAPLMALAIVLAFVRLRTYAYVLLPLACYLAGLSLTVFAGRYRVTSDPLILVCLAGFLADLLFGSKTGSFWRGRWPKLALALLVVSGSIAAHVSGVDRGWYRLAAPPEPQPEFDASLGNLIRLDVRDLQQVRHLSTKSCDVQLDASSAGLRCEVRGTPADSGFQYGGIRLPADGMTAVRMDITWLNPDNIDALFIDGRDAGGKVLQRWEWRPRKGKTGAVPGKATTCVLIAGQHSGHFTPRTNDRTARVAELRIIVRVKRDSDSGFVLHNLAIAVPVPDTPGECAPMELPSASALNPVEVGAEHVYLGSDGDGLRCEVVGGADGSGEQQGGLSFRASVSDALRMRLAFHDAENIEAVYVDGHADNGERILRWAWDLRRTGYPLPGTQTYVLVPGETSGPFLPEGEVRPDEVRQLVIQVRVAPGTRAGFTLHGLEDCRTPVSESPP